MAKLNPDSFRNQTDALFPTNNVGEIDASDLRQQLDNISDSVTFVATIARAPTAADDKYNIGDIWLDTNATELYYCTGNSSGAATWVAIATEIETPSGASGNFVEWGASGIVDSGKSVPSGDVVGTDDTQTLTNKTIDANNNTILNLTSGINVQEEGSTVVSEAATVNFVGSELTVTDVGGVATVTHVPGSITVSGDDITSGTVAIDYLPEATEAEYLDNTPNKLISTDQLWTSVGEKTLSYASTVPIDLSSGINFEITLTGDCVFEAPTNAKPGQSGHIRVVQDGTGNRTISYDYGYEFAGGNAPVLSTTAGAEDLLFYKALTSDRIFINAITGVEPGAVEPPQPDFNNVIFLVPMDGDVTDYSNNNVSLSTQLFSYTNDDPYEFTDAQAGNFTAGGDSRVYTGSTPFGTAQYLGTGDLCIEAWVWRDSSAPTSGVAQIVGDYDNNFFNNNTWRLLIDQGNGRRIRLQTNGGPNITFTSAVTDETWHHVALVRDSGTIYLYFDGVQDATTTTSGFNFGGDSETIWIGRGQNPAPYDGYIADVRFTKGEPVYTANFDRPKNPHPRS